MISTATVSVLGVGLVLSGCSDRAADSEPEPAYEPLVTLDGWSGVERADDVFVTDPELVPSCLGAGFFIENGWVEIDTTVCNWVTLQGTARFAVERGQELRLVVSHFDLTALEPAQAELRLRLGDCDAWERTVSIPHVAAVYTEPISSPCALDASGIVQFHLHNHGQNNWQLQELALLR